MHHARSTTEPAERRFTTEEYYRMSKAGLFVGERVQLIEGRIVSMTPQGSSHAGATQYLNKVLVHRLGDRAEVRAQLPFTIRDGSEPEPDIAVVAPGAYRDAHPTAALLVIEVADSSLALDRTKAKLYASAGVAEYWIVNLPDRRIEVHREPEETGYARVAAHRPGDRITLVAFPDIELAVTDVLG